MANARASGGFSLGSHTQNALGCIATYDNGDVRHFHQRDYVRAAAEHADAHSTLIVSLSTPLTIFRDLQGTRGQLEPRHNTTQPPDRIAVPEVSMLGKIGRRDLLKGWEAQPKHG